MNKNKIKTLIVLLIATIVNTPVFAQQTDSLSHYLEMAGRNNPGVVGEFMRYKASLEKIPQAGAYQDPQLEIGFFLEPMQILGGKQVAQFKLMQMFPWFGTQKSARSEASYMAKMAFEQFRETRDNLYLQVYSQWFVLCNLQQKLINSRENKTLLTQLEELSVRKFSSPTANKGTTYSTFSGVSSSSSTSASQSGGAMASMGGAKQQAISQSSGMTSMSSSGGGMGTSTSSGMSDVLRIQLEMAELDNTIESLLSEMKAEKVKFNTLLNRSIESEVQVPDTFEQIPFIYDAENSMATIGQQNPMLNMINEEGRAYQAKKEMDKKMGYPMFGIGLQYVLNKKTDMEMFAMGDMNGKDMVMPMVTVSIPIYRNKYKAQQRESEFLMRASKEKYTDTYNQLESELYKNKHLLDDASRKIALYKKQTELAKTTYNLVVQEFVTGKSDLTNVIQVQRQLLDYQLKASEAVADYNTMVASIQKLISFKDTEQNANNTYYGHE